MTDIVIAIDGTGKWDNDAYKEVMEGGEYKSFASRISKSAENRGAKVFYQRGPSLLAPESSFYATLSVMKYVASLARSDTNAPIRVFITGFSRGAMIATYVANQIAKFNTLHGLYSKTTTAMKRNLGFKEAEPVDINLESVILFDSVDSDITMGGPEIRKLPASVKAGTHFICGNGSTSRSFFNRIVLGNPSSQIRVKPYRCTHSCIGGIPGEGDAAPNKSDFTNNKAIFSGDMTQKSWGARMLAEAGFEKCNVTIAEDKQIFKRIEADVNRQLQAQNWPASL